MKLAENPTTSTIRCRRCHPTMSPPLRLDHMPQIPARAADGRFCPVHQMMHEILKNRRIELVVNLLALSLREHESRVAKNSQMTRDRGPARIEPSRDFPRSPPPAAQHSQDLAPCVVRQSAERAVCRSSHSVTLV